ncbi:hypothetical protein KKB69_01700 [Patescibacteria group bacterium]|nr:hypothetical protein [Patescibacteria group bacterium]
MKERFKQDAENIKEKISSLEKEIDKLIKKINDLDVKMRGNELPSKEFKDAEKEREELVSELWKKQKKSEQLRKEWTDSLLP